MWLLAAVEALAGGGAVLLFVRGESVADGYADADPHAFTDFEAMFQADLRRSR